MMSGWSGFQPGETTILSKSEISISLGVEMTNSLAALDFSSAITMCAPRSVNERATAFPVTPAPKIRIRCD